MEEAGGSRFNKVEVVVELEAEGWVAFVKVLLVLEGREASVVEMESECTQNSQSTNIRNKTGKKSKINNKKWC